MVVEGRHKHPCSSTRAALEEQGLYILNPRQLQMSCRDTLTTQQAAQVARNSQLHMRVAAVRRLAALLIGAQAGSLLTLLCAQDGTPLCALRSAMPRVGAVLP